MKDIFTDKEVVNIKIETYWNVNLTSKQAEYLQG